MKSINANIPKKIKAQLVGSRRLPFTLLEVLIVVLILILIGSVIGFNVSYSVKEQKFYKEVNQMVETMRLAQDLMLILNTDVYLVVEGRSNQRGFKYWLEMEKDVPNELESVVRGTEVTTSEIHSVSLDPQESEEEGRLVLAFQSGGSIMTKGIFRMSTHENVRAPGATTFSVCLKGYPHPIFSVRESDQGIDCNENEDETFDRNLTVHTVQEIMEDNEVKKAQPKKD